MTTLSLALTLFLAFPEEDPRWMEEDSVPPLPARHRLAEAINAAGMEAFRREALAEPASNLVLSPFALSLSRDTAGPFHAATLAHLRDTTRELFVRIGQRHWERAPDSLALDAWAFKTSGAALKSLEMPAGPADGAGAAGLRSHVLYLQGYWLAQRGHGRRGFRRPDGTVSEVPMLAFDEPYVHVDSVRILQVPFAEGRYSLVLVLPDSGRSLAQVIDGLGEEEWRIWMSLRPLIRSQGAFPELHLVQLRTLGSIRPTIRYGIRLTVGNDKHRLMPERIERVIGGARWFRKPGYRGELRPSHPLPELRFDRPFLFAVRDTRSGLLLLLGRVTDPSASPRHPRDP